MGKMMSDLTERLRGNPRWATTDEQMEAADEIERLTAENMELHADAMEFDEKLTKVAILRLDLETENIRLQARVEALEAAMRKAANERYFNAALQVLADALATTEQDLRQPSPLKDVDTFTSDSTNEQGESDDD